MASTQARNGASAPVEPLTKTKALRKTTAPSVPATTCSQCGELTGTEARFCPYCGHERSTAPAGTSPEPTPELDTEIAPAVPVVPSPTRAGWLRRRRVVVPVAAAVVVVLATSGYVATRGKAGYDVKGGLQTTLTAASKPWDDLGRATTMAQLTTVAKSEPALEKQLRGVDHQLATVSNDDDRAASRAAVKTELAALAVVGRLAHLSTDDHAKWTHIADDLDAAGKNIAGANGALADAKLPSTGHLSKDVVAAAAQLRVTLSSMHQRLAAWDAEMARVQADKTKQQDEVDAYSKQFKAETDKYAGLRAELGDFSDHLLNGSGLFSDAYASLGAAKSQREQVRNEIASLTPPAAMVASHTQVLSAVDDSIKAVQSAIDGLNQFQFDYYYSIESTPGWTEFTRESDQVASAFTSAESSWEKQLGDEQARIAAIVMPARPVL